MMDRVRLGVYLPAVLVDRLEDRVHELKREARARGGAVVSVSAWVVQAIEEKLAKEGEKGQ